MLAQSSLNPIYQATAEATEESTVNALIAAVTTTGRGGVAARRIPVERVLGLVKSGC